MNRASWNGEPLRDKVGFEVVLIRCFTATTQPVENMELQVLLYCGARFFVYSFSSRVLPASPENGLGKPYRNVIPAVLGSATSFRNKAL